jgi:CHAT domain-containing protein/tetratricopeptide (TPR) repeat protein
MRTRQKFHLALARGLVLALACVSTLSLAQTARRGSGDLVQLIQKQQKEIAQPQLARCPDISAESEIQRIESIKQCIAALERNGRWQLQKAQYQQLLSLLTTRPRVEQLNALHELSNKMRRYDDPLKALSIKQSILSDPAATNNLKVVQHQALAIDHALVFLDASKARKNLQEMEAINRARRSGLRQEFVDLMESTTAGARGAVLLAEGQFGEAIKAYEQYLKGYGLYLQQIPVLEQTLRVDTVEAVKGYIYTGRTYLVETLLQSGDVDRAEREARALLKEQLQEISVYAPQTARTLVLYSRILTGQGRFKEAAYFLDQALQALDLSGVEPEARLRLQASAAKIDLYLLQGKYPEAYSTWNSYRQQKQMSGEPPAFDPAWGVLLHQAGQPKLALELATQSWQKTSVKLTPGSWRRAEVDAFYALALLTNHQQKEASPLLENSLPVLAKAFVGGSNYGHEFMRTKLMLLLDGLAAAIPQHGMNAKLFAPVWQLSEALKYSAVHKAVAASMARNTNNKELSQWIRDEQDQGVLAQNLSKAIENLEANVDGGGQDILVRLREKLDKTEQSRAQLLSRIQAKFPAYAQLLAGMPIPLNELISQLKQGESYLSMLPLPSGVLVMAVNAHGAEKMHFSKLSHDQVQKLTQQLRASIDFTSVPENQILPDYDFESAHSLYANLIEPVQEAIQGNRLLLISTSGDLSSLPLSMWTTRPFSPSPSKIKFESYKQAPWFSLDVDMAYIPSATALVSLRAATASTSKKLTFAGFGDPDFTVNKPSPSSPPAHVGVRASQLLERVSEEEVLLRGPLPEAIPNIPALPETRDEVLSLAKLLGADPSRSVYLGDQASRQNALKKDLSSFNVLAFATHGLIPGDVPGLNQPALALTSQDPTGFLLTAQDILGMRLNADWVILSACNSAAGDGASADALTGLGRSFFYAGSRSVYATHWPVESDSARQLVLKTLEVYQGQGLGRAAAAGAAARHLLKNVTTQMENQHVSYAHPAFWAPYVVVGEPGR